MNMSNAREMESHTPAVEGAGAAAHLFATMMRVAPDKCADVVKQLAQEGNIPLLREVFASNTINPTSKFGADIACALAPLVAAGEHQQERTALVDRWLHALGLDTPQKRGACLPNALLSQARILLNVFGADPLTIVPADPIPGIENCTALGKVFLSKEPGKGAEMLSVLAKDERYPAAYDVAGKTLSIFDAIVATDRANNSSMQAASTGIIFCLARMEMPEEWQREAGRSLLRYIEENGKIDHRKDIATLALMSLARFDDPKQWVKVMGADENPHSIAGSLLDLKPEDTALLVIANMKRDKVELDRLYANVHKESKLLTMPLLHAAVALDNSVVACALLEAGCSHGVAPCFIKASNKIEIEVVEQDALAAADPGSVSTKMVLSWKAKQSIEEVIAQARNRAQGELK